MVAVLGWFFVVVDRFVLAGSAVELCWCATCEKAPASVACLCSVFSLRVRLVLQWGGAYPGLGIRLGTGVPPSQCA